DAVLAPGSVQCDECAVEAFIRQREQARTADIDAVSVDTAPPQRIEHRGTAPQRHLPLGRPPAHEHGNAPEFGGDVYPRRAHGCPPLSLRARASPPATWPTSPAPRVSTRSPSSMRPS